MRAIRILRPDLTLLRWRFWSARNRVLLLRDYGVLQLVWLSCLAGIALIEAYWQFCAILNSLAQRAAFHTAPAASLSVIVFLVIGLIAGYKSVRWHYAATVRPWLTSLAWSEAARQRAIISSVATTLLLMAIPVLGLECMVGQKLLWPGAVGPVAATMFGLGGGLGGWLAPRTRTRIIGIYAPEHPTALSWPLKILARFDRRCPSWAGSWTMQSRLGPLSFSWLGLIMFGISLAVGAHYGAARTSLATPIAVFGPLVILMQSLRTRPLLSSVLRSTSLGHLSACGAMLRLPVLLSGCWLLAFCSVMGSLNLLSGTQAISACLVSVLVGGLYAMLALALPGRERWAVGLFIGTLWFAFYEYESFQNGVFIIIALTFSFLLTRARQHYRHG